MRTRIALAAATTAAVAIGISSTAVAASAAAAPARRARVTRLGDRSRPGRGSRDTVTGRLADAVDPLPAGSAADAPGGFLSPALSAVHRWDARHRLGRDATPVAGPAQAGGVTAHQAQMRRVIDARRSAQPAPAAAPPPPPPPPVVLTDATSTTTPDWACIRVHESGDRFNTPAAPGGAYGFLETTWLSLGYSGYPYQAAPAVQDQAVLFLYNELGWQPWSTRFVCGL